MKCNANISVDKITIGFYSTNQTTAIAKVPKAPNPLNFSTAKSLKCVL